MKQLSDEQWERLIRDLQDFERIAEALYRDVGNESTIELHLRLQALKKVLAAEEWQ